MSKKKKLEYIDELLGYGMFSELIPDCFNSKALKSHRTKLLHKVSGSKLTAPATLPCYKNGSSRRLVSTPNPYAFVAMVKFISDQWKNICKYSKSKHSQSPITFLVPYFDLKTNEDKIEEHLNCITLRDSLNLKSDFVSSLKERIRAALGFRYKVDIDISTFFDSIYTHAISWSICGKDAAKTYFIARDKGDETITIPTEYNFGVQMDKLIRCQRNKETNGIITGPFTSKVFAEILAAGVDKEIEHQLKEANIKSIFYRYVDDYSFYFRTKEEAENAIIRIEAAIQAFNLNINQSKTTITEYPFDQFYNMKERLYSLARISRKGGDPSAFDLLNAANILHSEGVKGAQKYAMKIVRNMVIDEEEIDLVLSLLFNITLTNPSYGRYAISLINKNISLIKPKKLSETLNEVLSEQLDGKLEQETAYMLYFAKVLGAEVTDENILKATKMKCDYVRIIALDYWVNNNDKVTKTLEDDQAIPDAISSLTSKMQDENMDGDHWLLLYEAHMHELLDGIDISKGETGSFFEFLEELGVSFYEGF